MSERPKQAEPNRALPHEPFWPCGPDGFRRPTHAKDLFIFRVEHFGNAAISSLRPGTSLALGPSI